MKSSIKKVREVRPVLWGICWGIVVGVGLFLLLILQAEDDAKGEVPQLAMVCLVLGIVSGLNTALIGQHRKRKVQSERSF